MSQSLETSCLSCTLRLTGNTAGEIFKNSLPEQ